MKLVISPEITLLPTPRTKLKEFRALLLKILAAWLSNEFAVGDTVIEPKTWKLMVQAIAMLPRDGGGEWKDLDAFANDYEWIEKVFFAQKKSFRIESGVATFDLLEWVPGQIVQMHYLDGTRLIKEAHSLIFQ
jgi:hypothetical protein